MKKYLILAASLSCLILFAFWTLEKLSLFARKDAILGGLTHDIAMFYREKNRLPQSWLEFDKWSEKSPTVSHWNAADLSGHFALAWGEEIDPGNSRDQKIFIVLDPHFKDIEPSMNDQLRDLCRPPPR